ncbi:MAG: class I SAM-dependent methyltransferase, partial [Candidatus Eiseniibacteriota bacterium]
MRVAVVQNMSPGGAWRTLVEQCRDPRRLGFCRGASNDGSLEFLKAREEGPLDVAVSPRNPLRYPPNLRRRYRALTLSEYFDDIRPGDWKGGVQCQDVQRLTYPDDSFDLVTSTEVFEHVPDDGRAFAEVHRVLRPGGFLVFTVPLMDTTPTLERARIERGAIVHLVAPEYHGDR